MTKIFHTMGSRKRDYVLPEGTNIFVSEEYVEKAIEEAGKNPLPPTAKPKKSTKPKTDPDPNPDPSIIIPPTKITDLENWIYLPGKVHGTYSYPNSLICNYRLSATDEVVEAGEKINLEISNTATDTLGRGYVGNLGGFENAMKLNLLLGNETLPLRDFADFLFLLYRGANENLPVYNGKKERIDSGLLRNLFEDITAKVSPWRAEHIDADYYIKKKKPFVNYCHKIDASGNLVVGRSEKLGNYFSKSGTIDFLSWIQTANYLGLPTEQTKQGELNYYPQANDNNSVAGFGAYSGRANLSCRRDRSGSGARLGVRAVRRLAP